MSTLISLCPKCKGELTSGGVPHCDPTNRPKPCGWIKHRPCGAVVDPRNGGRFFGGPTS